MIILASGDSFVYGSELKDCTRTQHSLSTYSALLSKGHEYKCVAEPGKSNDSIARSVVTACHNMRPDIVLVSWTFPSRYEFRFSYNTGQKSGNWYCINNWTIAKSKQEVEKEFVAKNEGILKDQLKTIERAKVTGVAEFAESYYKHVASSEYWEIYSTLKEIVFLQSFLKSKNIPYLFTCADNSIAFNYTVRHPDATIESFYTEIDWDRWFWFPQGNGSPDQTNEPRGFYQWAKENKYNIGTTHPLEDAHFDAAALMKDKFDELVKEFI